MKAYVVQSSGNYDDGWNTRCVFLDIAKGKAYVDKMNRLYDKANESADKCYDCTCEEGFKFRNSCDRCDIKTDRHGEYCDNELSSYDVAEERYYGVEVDIKG